MGLDQYIFITYTPEEIYTSGKYPEAVDGIVSLKFEEYSNDPESKYVTSTKNWCYFRKGYSIARFLMPYTKYSDNASDWLYYISFDNMKILYTKLLEVLLVIKSYHREVDCSIDNLYNTYSNGYKFCTTLDTIYNDKNILPNFIRDLKSTIDLTCYDSEVEVAWWNLPYYIDLLLLLHHIFINPDLQDKYNTKIGLIYLEC